MYVCVCAMVVCYNGSPDVSAYVYVCFCAMGDAWLWQGDVDFRTQAKGRNTQIIFQFFPFLVLFFRFPIFSCCFPALSFCFLTLLLCFPTFSPFCFAAPCFCFAAHTPICFPAFCFLFSDTFPVFPALSNFACRHFLSQSALVRAWQSQSHEQSYSF